MDWWLDCRPALDMTSAVWIFECQSSVINSSIVDHFVQTSNCQRRCYQAIKYPAQYSTQIKTAFLAPGHVRWPFLLTRPYLTYHLTITSEVYVYDETYCPVIHSDRCIHLWKHVYVTHLSWSQRFFKIKHYEILKTLNHHVFVTWLGRWEFLHLRILF